MWDNKAFRVWCFGSACWLVAYALFYFWPVGYRVWFHGDLSTKFSVAFWVPLGIPALVGAALFAYRRFIR